MKNAYDLRNHFFLDDYNTAITREDFDRHFTKTREKVTFTFNGWDGKSYDGESRTASVYRTDIEGFERLRLVKVGKGLHYIDEACAILEKSHRRDPPGSRVAGGCEKSASKPSDLKIGEATHPGCISFTRRPQGLFFMP